jgi:hypothetical protein
MFALNHALALFILARARTLCFVATITITIVINTTIQTPTHGFGCRVSNSISLHSPPPSPRRTARNQLAQQARTIDALRRLLTLHSHTISHQLTTRRAYTLTFGRPPPPPPPPPPNTPTPRRAYPPPNPPPPLPHTHTHLHTRTHTHTPTAQVSTDSDWKQNGIRTFYTIDPTAPNQPISCVLHTPTALLISTA